MPTFANLPGVAVDITDQGLRISRAPSGPKITLLGLTTSTETEATPYVPYNASDATITNAYLKFKNADGTVSELCQALMEAYSAGGRNIEIMNVLPTASGALISDDDVYGYLDYAYLTLLNLDVDIAVPVGVVLDSLTLTGDRSFGYQLANFCYQATANSNTTIGVIGVAGPTASASGTPTIVEVENWVTSLAAYTNCPEYDGTTDDNGDGVPDNYRFAATTSEQMPASWANGDVLDAKGNKVDIGAYLSVVAAPVRATNDAATDLYPTLGYYNSTGVPAYAGLIATLPAKSAPTNKIVSGISMQRDVSLSQADRLAGSRFVPVFAKPKGIVAASAMTGAYNISQYYRSDFTRLSTVRIVHDAVNFVRDVSDQFIGEPNSAPQRNALSTAIDNALKSMQSQGALRRYDFNIFASATDQVLGRATVELELVPAFELQQITVIVALAAE
jgi:hypothetical protein